MFGDLGKLIVAKGFKKLPKVQKIATSGHTGISGQSYRLIIYNRGSGCGSVGRAVAYDTRGLRFDYSHWQNLIEHLFVNVFIINCIEKTKNK